MERGMRFTYPVDRPLPKALGCGFAARAEGVHRARKRAGYGEAQ